MNEFFKRYMIIYLKSEGIDYKQPESYAKIKDDRIFYNNSNITVGEYIERFLLTEKEAFYIYESIYDMGNTVELTDDDLQYTALATEIFDNMKLETSDDISDKKKYQI